MKLNKFIPLIYLSLVVLVIWLFAQIFTDIFVYIIASAILATILRPLTNRINNLYFYGLQLPRGLAVFVSFLAFAFVVAILVGLFIPLISEQVSLLSRLNFENAFERIANPLIEFEVFLLEQIPGLGEPGFIYETFKNSLFGLIRSIDFTYLINQFISITGSLLISILAVLFITFFFLYEKGLIRRKFINLIPNRYFEVSIVALFKIEHLLSNYLIGLLFQMASIFTIASVGLSIFGIKYALTIALFAAIANLIPYAGPILGASFGIIVGLSTTGSFDFSQPTIFMIIKIVSVFSVVQLTDNILLQPLIFSKSVKAHPLEIFVIIFAGASLAGVIGMIAAIPVYTIIRVIGLELYSGYKQYRVFQN
jgi:predicted PurR-regulated permease PerM